ncbi:DUF2304 domain-containing protein [Herbiconiux sp. KACC 21604]|uniref:DUF2304 domain-containing protein n=1 Tax=unclassified Herbiconiux TaxID=2618217 RepID=UPI0014910392|nr:DUF2304 domain-containing protein [Herbiconiux sp. SALV-R1]QJU54419.1 DUF2304 domain-containing protein [Herbiconiux sp. SALV-R1]WPO85493.1 DUF2304 domain-containing protein [Herbiconiux sp. KACC 21604]
MSVASYLLGIVAALITLGVVVESLRRRHLRERHAIWWLLAGTVALVIGIFPGILGFLSGLVGVTVPSNLVFFLSIAVLFFVSIQHSGELTELEGETRTLAEAVALQELRISELERALAESQRASVETPRALAESQRASVDDAGADSPAAGTPGTDPGRA